VAVLGFAAIQAKPLAAGDVHQLPSEPKIAAAAVAPVEGADAAYPDDHEAGPDASRSDPAPDLIWPAPGKITSPFGDHRNHPGIDIDGVTGDPVQAAGRGTVLTAGAAPAEYSGYGNVVVIDDGGGITTLYAHLSRVDVAVGQAVEQAQQIGLIGNTGASTGDHLHFEVRVLNKPVDPMPYLPPRS
jgi:murein DD-endopeptidase MepM/ murein hydrolase activator NlpD